MARWMFVMCLLVWIAEAQSTTRIFNVKDYGAVADGNTDNSVAFLKAWGDACKWCGNAQVLIPEGTYMVNSAIFNGPCKGWRMDFVIKGVLKAPTDPSLFNTDKWIGFIHVSQLTVSGGGTLDGQGASAWPHNDCNKNPNCPPLPTTMRFDFITSGSVHDLHSINSKSSHFVLYGCENMNLTNLTISAPGDSPNTDGIKIGESYGVNITSVNIGTGDDCIAMISGARKIRILDVYCGPGHGISVGSLGKSDGEQDVQDIAVKNCTFNGTSDGLRIKSWAAPLSKTLKAFNFVYEDIIMDNVYIPINIDQAYCPNPPCKNKGTSNVQISNVTYNNVRGSGNSDVGVSFNCSEGKPCQNITLVDINLWPYGGKGELRNLCCHVNGASYGKQNPPSCIQ